MNKPKLPEKQLIEKMKNEKGITFNYISEEEAENFLQRKNNYYHYNIYVMNSNFNLS